MPRDFSASARYSVVPVGNETTPLIRDPAPVKVTKCRIKRKATQSRCIFVLHPVKHGVHHCSRLTSSHCVMIMANNIVVRRGSHGQLRRGRQDIRSDMVELHNLDELVECGSEQGTKDWAKPVDPVVAGESTAGDDFRAEGARGVQTATGVPDAPGTNVSTLLVRKGRVNLHQLRNEQGHADDDW